LKIISVELAHPSGSFNIYVPGRVYVMKATSEVEASFWLESITRPKHESSQQLAWSSFRQSDNRFQIFSLQHLMMNQIISKLVHIVDKEQELASWRSPQCRMSVDGKREEVKLKSFRKEADMKKQWVDNKRLESATELRLLTLSTASKSQKMKKNNI